MCPPTMDEAGRRRLVEAQRREAEAMHGVAAANRRRAALQDRIDAADQAVATAYHRLVSVSGLNRAALLTAMSVAELRRLTRDAPPLSEPDDEP